MGHMIQCFIGPDSAIREIVAPIEPVTHRTVKLPQGLCCLFYCENVYDSIHEYQMSDNDREIEPFSIFSNTLIMYLESIRPKGNFIYIETDYAGGTGYQAAGAFKNGKLMEARKTEIMYLDRTDNYPEVLLDKPINTALRDLGVIRRPEADEFDTLDLGNYRTMPIDGKFDYEIYGN